jgi:hypothetical protein
MSQSNQSQKSSFEGYSYIHNGKLIGPMSLERLHAAWESGSMHEYAFVCYSDGNGLHSWDPVHKYRHLKPRVPESEVSHGYATILVLFPVLVYLVYFSLTSIIFEFGRVNPHVTIFSPENIQTTFKIYQTIFYSLMGVSYVVASDLDERAMTSLGIPKVNAGFWGKVLYPIYLYKRGVHLERCFNCRWNSVRWMYALSLVVLGFTYRFLF